MPHSTSRKTTDKIMASNSFVYISSDEETPTRAFVPNARRRLLFEDPAEDSGVDFLPLDDTIEWADAADTRANVSDVSDAADTPTDVSDAVDTQTDVSDAADTPATPVDVSDAADTPTDVSDAADTPATPADETDDSDDDSEAIYRQIRRLERDHSLRRAMIAEEMDALDRLSQRIHFLKEKL